jgi:cytochrome c oxidase cbb3-type subunit 3
MAVTEKDALTGTETTGHEWDGLKELNTPLPKWWLYLFFATILFAAVWVVLYPAIPMTGATGTTGWTARGAIGAVMDAERAKQEPMLARIRAVTPAQIAADPELRAYALAGGRGAFALNCAACHGAGGQGAQGERGGGFPSLADDDWIWGGSFDAIQATIRHGIRNAEDPDARNSVMMAYQASGVLTAAQVNDVAEYVLSLTSRAGDTAAAQRGQALYAENCVACHQEGGTGNRELGAPRLNDQVWLFGGDKASIVRSIANGRGGVMPPWGGRLDAATVNMLTVYVHALGGGE